MSVSRFWIWSFVAAVSTGCSVLAASEGHGGNAAVIGGIAAFAGLGAFRELAHELVDRLAPRSSPPYNNVAGWHPKP